ncbi:MAG: PEP-CTERM sorting domain-containing protein [Sulfuriferula sp.]
MSQIAKVSVVSNKPRMLGKTAMRLFSLLISLAITEPVWAATLIVSGAPGTQGAPGTLNSSYPGVFNFTAPGNGGAGGNAIADTSGTLTDNNNTATAYGGNGGGSGNVVEASPYSYVNGEGGIGGNAVANAPTSPLSGSATSNATAYGGSGGGSGFEASGGAGGAASASTRALASGSGSANATSTAYGGAGGEANYNGNSGAANAIARAIASGSGSANATSMAYGNTGYSNSGVVGYGNGGAASATALSTTVGSYTGTAQAVTEGVSGTALAQSSASNGLGQKAMASASAPTTLAGTTVKTQANFGANWFGPPPSSSNGLAAYSNVVASPSATTVAQILGNTHPDVSNALSNNTILGAGSLGAGYVSGAVGRQTYTAGADYLYTTNGSRAFTLGLLNIGAYSGGFDSLSFTVKNGGTTLLSDTFTNLASAQRFFTDTPYSLGNLDGKGDLVLNYSLTANAAQGAGISYMIGMATPAVPEPGEWFLFLLGLGILGLKERRRLFDADRSIRGKFYA